MPELSMHVCTPSFFAMVYLQQRFSSCYGYAAFGIECRIPSVLLEYFFGFHKSAAIHGPCIGVVAVSTAHRAALHKNYESGAGAIDCAKRF